MLIKGGIASAVNENYPYVGKENKLDIDLPIKRVFHAVSIL